MTGQVPSAVAATSSGMPAGAAELGEVVLRLNGVHTYYGKIHALQGIDLEVRQGEIVTLIGSNGAGKTTTLKTISGLLHPREGSVELFGKDMSRVPPHNIVKSGIGHAPEGRRIFSRLTVAENLQMGGFTRTARDVADRPGARTTRSSRGSGSG